MPKPLPKAPPIHFEDVKRAVLPKELREDVRELREHKVQRVKEITAVLLGKFDAFLHELSRQEVTDLYAKHLDKNKVIRVLRYRIIRSREMWPLLAELGRIDFGLTGNMMNEMERILRERYEL